MKAAHGIHSRKGSAFRKALATRRLANRPIRHRAPPPNRHRQRAATRRGRTTPLKQTTLHCEGL